MIISTIRDYVHQACRLSENIFGPAFFDEHLAPVAHRAAQLAAALHADTEIVALAAWLHDLSAVLDSTTIPEHARLSAEMAARVLADHGYPSARAALVSSAIAPHSNPIGLGAASPEAVSISNADALARLDRPAYWLYFAFAVRKLPFAEGRQWLRALIERQWPLLIPPARDLARDQHVRVMKFLV